MQKDKEISISPSIQEGVGKTYAEALLNDIPPFSNVSTLSPHEEQKEYRKFLESSPKIKLCDSDESLDMFNYASCNNESELAIRHSRGIVFHGDTLIARSFPYTVEYPESRREEVSSLLRVYPFNEIKFYPSLEGTLIRMFNFNDKWYVSTHRKLNAFTCTWGHTNLSYGDIFQNEIGKIGYSLNEAPSLYGEPHQTLGSLQEHLQKDKVYMFLILSNEKTRIVSLSKGGVYFVGGFHNDKFFTEPPNGFPSLKELEFNSIDEIFGYVAKIDPFMEQGVIAHFPGMLRVKILNETYHRYSSLRGNTPSVNFAYLKIRGNPIDNSDFRLIYPEYVSQFDEYEFYLDRISKDLLQHFKERFISRKFIEISPQKHWVIKKCYDTECDNGNRKVTDITLKDIKRYMEMQNYQTLNLLINKEKKLERKMRELSLKKNE